MTRTDLKPTRRDVLRQLALAVTAAGAGAFNLEAARVVHALAGEARAQPGGYRPQALDLHQFRTVTRLAELIVPAEGGVASMPVRRSLSTCSAARTIDCSRSTPRD